MNSKYSQADLSNINALREALRKRQGSNETILGGPALLNWLLEYFEKIKLDVDFEDIDVAFGALRENGEIVAKVWNSSPPGNPLRGRVTLNFAPLPKAEYVRNWQEAVEVSDFDSNAKKVLRKSHVAKRFIGLTKEDMGAILRGLRDLADTPKRDLTEFIASAKHLVSSSKLLGVFGKAERSVIGLGEELFHPQPRYLAVAGPENPIGTLLIENPQSFEQAVLAGVAKKMVLISVYGYGLASTAKKDIESFWGESMESDADQLIPLIRKGNPPSLQKAFELEKLLWWGDLDLAGLDIFQRLRKQLPALKLSALYDPMVKILHAGGGHPYVACVGKEKQPERYSNTKWEEDMQDYLNLCKNKAVDQEVVPRDLIINLCSKVLSEIGEG